MRSINYILVNETGRKNAVCDITYRDLPNVGYCIECFAVPGFKVQDSRERAKLLDELVRLRRHWPEAPILGMSELDTSSKHAPVRVSAFMNALRREMSNLP